MSERTIRKPCEGTASTDHGEIGYRFTKDRKVHFSDGGVGELYLHKTPNNPRGKWALVIACCQGSSDASPRRAIERGLKEIVGYCLC